MDKKPEVFWRNQTTLQNKPPSQKSFRMRPEFFGGYCKNFGTSQNFLEGTLVQTHIVHTWGARPPFLWAFGGGFTHQPQGRYDDVLVRRMEFFCILLCYSTILPFALPPPSWPPSELSSLDNTMMSIPRPLTDRTADASLRLAVGSGGGAPPCTPRRRPPPRWRS